jgi:ribosome-associated protein
VDWSIIEQELTFRTTRSSGAGGQHVNKTETKVTVLFDPSGSSGLNAEEKEVILEKLSSLISSDGWISISSQKSRSQADNKEDSIEKLKQKLIKALTPRAKRKATKPSAESIEARLTRKKQLGEKKALRRKPDL